MPDNVLATPAPAPPPEGFLHSLATSLGIDPEAVKATAHAIFASPKQAASEIGHEISDEVSAMVQKPLETAKTVGQGVVSALTNPEAQDTASARLSKSGFANKLAGIQEYAYSAIPLVGSGLVKAEEQATEGNVRGSLGTMTGIAAPFFTGAAEDIPGKIHEAGADARESMALRKEARLNEARTGKVIDIGPQKVLGEPAKQLGPAPVSFADAGGTEVNLAQGGTEAPAAEPEPKIFTDSNGIKWAEDPTGVRVSIPNKIPDAEVPEYAKTKLAEQATAQAKIKAQAPSVSFDEVGGKQLSPPVGYPETDTLINPPKAGATKGTALSQTSDELSVPKELQYSGPAETRSHEIAHILVGDEFGFPQVKGYEGVKSFLHPNVPNNTTRAWVNLNFSKAFQSPEAFAANIGNMVTTLVSGGVAQRLFHGTDIAENTGLSADLHLAQEWMKQAKLTPEEQKLQTAKSIMHAKDLLTRPETQATIRQYSENRTPGTARAFEIDPKTSIKMVQEHRGALKNANPKLAGEGATGGEGGGAIRQGSGDTGALASAGDETGSRISQADVPR